MRVCSAPWMASSDAGALAGLPLRPIAVQGSSRPPRLSGFRDSARGTSGEECSFEVPRPILADDGRQVRLHGTSLLVGLQVSPVADRPLPGALLASRSAAISAWLHEPEGDTCGSLRSRLLRELEAADAPESLVVEIARRHRFHIESVCGDPRVQLRRRRELQLVDRVRQLDAAGLRWLARQPGRTVAERAGPRERILSVRRYRSPDTLENQVLIDVVRRSRAMSKQYERLYRGFRQSERVRLVRDLAQGMSGLLEDPWIAEVRPITGIPTPNYALLSDRRYSPIWDLWRRILRQEQLFQSLEAWLPRLLAELLWVGCLAELNDSVGPNRWSPGIGGFPRLLFRPQFDSGDFLVGVQPLPPMWRRATGSGERMDFIRGDQLVQLGQWGRSVPAWTRLDRLRPDFGFAIRRDRGLSSALLVWSVAVWSQHDVVQLKHCLESLQSQIATMSASLGAPIDPLVVAYVAGIGCGTESLAGIRGVHIAKTSEDLLKAVPQEVVRRLEGATDAR